MLRDYMEYQLRRQVTTNGLTLMDESLTQPCRVKDDGPMGCKLLLYGNKPRYVYLAECTVRIRIG